VTITLGDDAVKTLADVLAPTLQRARQSGFDADERKEARLRASQNAIFAGEKPPEDQGLLIDSRQAARLLKVSERMLWSMHNCGAMPKPIRIGRAVRWSLEGLKKWVDAGCPSGNE